MRPTILFALFPLVAANAALAVDIKFCFKTTGDYTDNNFALSDGTTKEDFWTDDNDKYLRAAEAQIRLNDASGTILWPPTGTHGNLGDGSGGSDPGTGCTDTISLGNVVTVQGRG